MSCEIDVSFFKSLGWPFRELQTTGNQLHKTEFDLSNVAPSLEYCQKWSILKNDIS